MHKITEGELEYDLSDMEGLDSIESGKEDALGEDSFLGELGVDLSGINLTQLMGGTHLTISYTLSNNGYGVVTRALIDSRANGFVFINTQCAVDIARFLHLKTHRLPQSVPVKGYNGEQQPTDHSLLAAAPYYRLTPAV